MISILTTPMLHEGSGNRGKLYRQPGSEPKHMEVGNITGHKDLRMLGRYIHLKPEDLAREP